MPIDVDTFGGEARPEYAYGGAKQRELRRSAPSRQLVGVLTSSDIERDCTTQTDLVKCAHCGRFWQWVRGSGHLRSYCCQCGGITCGPLCPVGDQCITEEQVLDNMAAGMPWYEATQYKPIRARTGGAVSPGGVLLGR